MTTDSHVSNAIKYAISDKVNPENENEVYPTLNTFINCISDSSSNVISNSWKNIRKHFDKDNGNLAFQIIQNFGDGISPELANEIGVKYAKELLGNRQIIVSTHTNTDYTHNHIIFNSPELEKGNKYHDNRDSYYNKVRKISDRLCDEYGLKVLEDTRDGTLIFYKDNEGKRRAFEPTKRKSELEHFDSRYAQADVWNKDLNRRKGRAAKIITDMDMVIPMSDDFDDFLQKMRNMGYFIKAKTLAGEWRQHITYFEPDKLLNSKGIRDTNKLLSGYSRKEIEEKIKRLKELKHEQESEEKDIFSTVQSEDDNENIYEDDLQAEPKVLYSDVDMIHSDVRYDNSKRSEVDKFLVQEIKTMRKQVDDEFYSAFKRLPTVQPKNSKEKKHLDTIKRINLKVHVLNFMESYKMYAPSVLEDKMKQILNKRNDTAKQLDNVRSKLNVMNSYVATINKTKSLKEHINIQTALYGKSYTDTEGRTEIKMYDELAQKLRNVNLDSPEEQSDYISKVERYRNEYSQLAKGLQIISDNLYKCDDIYRVMKQCGFENTEELKRYEQVRFANRSIRKENYKSHESERKER